jgi:hypothetical protein
MLWKRQIPIAIVFVVGLLTLFGWFVDEPHVEAFVNDDATQWFDILASFAIFLGALNLLKLQLIKVSRQKPGWPYSLLAVLGFVFAFTVGFLVRGAYLVEVTASGSSPTAVAARVAAKTHGDPAAIEARLQAVEAGVTYRVESPFFFDVSARRMADDLAEQGATAVVTPIGWGEHVLQPGSLFNWMFTYVFTPLSATMFALLAFLVASASYRAFRIRNFEATLLLVAGIIIMLGRVPIGSHISSWFILYLLVLVLGIAVNSWRRERLATLLTVVVGFGVVTAAGQWMGWPVDRPAVFFLPELQDWIYNVPNVAGARAIMIGIGLGIIATSIRYILGIEKSYIGE